MPKPFKQLHLICNAHLDPVWQWEWQEGAAEAVSTFRCAAELCEQFDGFIFNHNEAILYRWIEEYEPALFRRIQRLVRQGKWHIMGGWYLQPDCNMPCGESLVRQILYGKRYFKNKFNVDVTTAVNFDSFGHTRGLVQILAKSGYDSYLFCRPSDVECELPGEQFVWEGYDGSTVLATRFAEGYGSHKNKALQKIDRWIEEHPDEAVGLVLWGVGNHGGGPSRQDLKQIQTLMAKGKHDYDVTHSTPEAYFKDLSRQRPVLPRHASDINPFSVGTYTSQARIKLAYRQLENELLVTEKMATTASAQGLMPYPQKELAEASQDLLMGTFHDILPGTSVPKAEAASLNMLHHGLEILARIKARAFFALSQGQKQPRGHQIPILVYNPHPYPVNTLIECEFNTEDADWDEGAFTQPTVYQGNTPLPTQCEKEASNIALDWRKKVVFPARLAPGQMSRFDCQLTLLDGKRTPQCQPRQGHIRFKTKELDVIINTRTGLMDRYRAQGTEFLDKGAFRPLVMIDNEDTWATRVRSFRKLDGAFKLMSRAEGTRFSGVSCGTIPSVRVIEDGPVRMVVEVVLAFRQSSICQRYYLPRAGTEVAVQTRVHWNEKDRMLKLSLPIKMRSASLRAQVAYGLAELPANGEEMVAQKWAAVVSKVADKALTCINNRAYGLDYDGKELRYSLVRSPAYSAFPIHDRAILPQDRYTPRTDQGEHVFEFWINGGKATQRLDAVHGEAMAHAEKPFALSFFPPATGDRSQGGPVLSDNVVQLTALKKAEDGDDLIVRLFEPTGHRRKTMLSLPMLGMKQRVELAPFEIMTLRINPKHKSVRMVDLMEQDNKLDKATGNKNKTSTRKERQR